MPCGFCGSALFFMVSCASLYAWSFVVPCQAESLADSGIISEERTISTGQAQRLSSVSIRSGPACLVREPIKASVKTPAKAPLLSSVSEQTSIQDVSKARTIQERPKVTENLLDSMDVYALSPHAAQLLLPRMIPQAAVQQWYARHHQAPQSSSTAEIRFGLSKADWDDIIQHASTASGLDAALIAAVIGVESGFDAYAVSPKGAQGAMQIMPTTQEELGLEDAFNPHKSVEAGSRYLRKQLDRFGSVELALAAYNAGAGNVERYGGIPPFKETQNYVRKVMVSYQRLLQTP